MFRIFVSISIFLLLAIQIRAQSDNLSWNYDYAEASSVVANGKPLLISFAGSDWCKPCIMLTREVFETELFQSYASENLVLLLADFPRLKKNKLSEEQTIKNEKLAKKFNLEGSFPLVVLVNEKEQVIGKLGYTPGGPKKFIEKIESLTSTL